VRRVEARRVVLAAGLAPGDEVCLSALDTATDGMPVRVAERAGSGDGR
jgi:hypothetical protein